MAKLIDAIARTLPKTPHCAIRFHVNRKWKSLRRPTPTRNHPFTTHSRNTPTVMLGIAHIYVQCPFRNTIAIQLRRYQIALARELTARTNNKNRIGVMNQHMIQHIALTVPARTGCLSRPFQFPTRCEITHSAQRRIHRTHHTRAHNHCSTRGRGSHIIYNLI